VKRNLTAIAIKYGHLQGIVAIAGRRAGRDGAFDVRWVLGRKVQIQGA
jgi:hypothetical protein